MNYIIYNPKAGATKDEKKFSEAKQIVEAAFKDFTYIDAHDAIGDFYTSLNKEDSLVIMAGDGTIHILVNRIKHAGIDNDVYLYCFGTGNDFLRDLDYDKSLNYIKINDYIKNLPVVAFNGVEEYFLNSSSLGLDAAVCIKYDENKKRGKSLNYKLIAFFLMLKHKHIDADIIVDGKEYHFKKVWLAAAMNGKYYGGGMKCAPHQDRMSDSVTLVVVSNVSKFKGLFLFSNVFKGKYEKYKFVKALTGHEITVKFKKPTAFETDGEAQTGISEYKITKRVSS